MEDHPSLDLRDAIHAAASTQAGIHPVVSDDPHLYDAPDLTRQPLTRDTGDPT